MTIPDKWESKEWEKVCEENGVSHTYRLRVPGGWLYKVLSKARISEARMQMCFVPNTAHHLYIQKLEKQLEDAQKEIEGHKTRLTAYEKERDDAITARDKVAVDCSRAETAAELLERERDQAITARDKWAADHARQKKEIEALGYRLEATQKERDHWKKACDKWAEESRRQKKEIQILKTHPISVQWSDTAKAAVAENKKMVTAHHLYIQKLEKQLEDAQKKIDAALLEIQYMRDDGLDWSDQMGT